MVADRIDKEAPKSDKDRTHAKRRPNIRLLLVATPFVLRIGSPHYDYTQG